MLMTGRDEYSCFAQLAHAEKEGDDYRIVAVPKPSPVLIIAPHGGKIEYGASQIATSVAAGAYSLYCFEGWKQSDNWSLHITSTRFDEPKALAMASNADLVVAVHGRRDDDDNMTVEMGGLDADFRQGIEQALMANGFAAKLARRFRGEDQKNICNRGRRNAGAQLEIPSTLRHALVGQAALLERFSDAVRGAIKHRIDELQIR